MFGTNQSIDLARLRKYRSKKISSYDRKGGNRDFVTIPKGGKHVIADIKCAGRITHIWITAACEDLLYPRKMVLRMFWDDEPSPSVECPLGDFFGVGHGVVSFFISGPLSMISTDPPIYNRIGMNCFFPMPFEKSARIEIENESTRDAWAFFYHVSYEEYDELEEGLGRFHAQWRRENPTDGWGDFKVVGPYAAYRAGSATSEVFDTPNLDGEGNYIILDAEGEGHYLGCNLSIHNITNKSMAWFGEGDEMIFIDGEPFPPSIHGTGMEDYFCSGFGFPGKFYTPNFGVSLSGDPRTMEGKWTLYRYHTESPINFQKSIRATIEHGHANNRSDDYSSTAYWYQTEPHKKFPVLLPVEKRLPREELKLTLIDYEDKENPRK
jgi:hypothetical protein